RHDRRHLQPVLDGVAEGHPAIRAQVRHGQRRVDRHQDAHHARGRLRALQHDPVPMRCPMTCRRHSSRGFSPAEILAATALSMMLMTAIYSVQHAQSKAFAAQSVYSESQNITRTVIDLMTRELRMATYDPGTAIPTSPGPSCPGVKQGIVE